MVVEKIDEYVGGIIYKIDNLIWPDLCTEGDDDEEVCYHVQPCGPGEGNCATGQECLPVYSTAVSELFTSYGCTSQRWKNAESAGPCPFFCAIDAPPAPNTAYINPSTTIPTWKTHFQDEYTLAVWVYLDKKDFQASGTPDGDDNVIGIMSMGLARDDKWGKEQQPNNVDADDEPRIASSNLYPYPDWSMSIDLVNDNKARNGGCARLRLTLQTPDNWFRSCSADQYWSKWLCRDELHGEHMLTVRRYPYRHDPEPLYFPRPSLTSPPTAKLDIVWTDKYSVMFNSAATSWASNHPTRSIMFLRPICPGGYLPMSDISVPAPTLGEPMPNYFSFCIRHNPPLTALADDADVVWNSYDDQASGNYMYWLRPKLTAGSYSSLGDFFWNTGGTTAVTDFTTVLPEDLHYILISNSLLTSADLNLPVARDELDYDDNGSVEWGSVWGSRIQDSPGVAYRMANSAAGITALRGSTFQKIRADAIFHECNLDDFGLKAEMQIQWDKEVMITEQDALVTSRYDDQPWKYKTTCLTIGDSLERLGLTNGNIPFVATDADDLADNWQPTFWRNNKCTPDTSISTATAMYLQRMWSFQRLLSGPEWDMLYYKKPCSSQGASFFWTPGRDQDSTIISSYRYNSDISSGQCLEGPRSWMEWCPREKPNPWWSFAPSTSQTVDDNEDERFIHADVSERSGDMYVVSNYWNGDERSAQINFFNLAERRWIAGEFRDEVKTEFGEARPYIDLNNHPIVFRPGTSYAYDLPKSWAYKGIERSVPLEGYVMDSYEGNVYIWGGKTERGYNRYMSRLLLDGEYKSEDPAPESTYWIKIPDAWCSDPRGTISRKDVSLEECKAEAEDAEEYRFQYNAGKRECEFNPNCDNLFDLDDRDNGGWEVYQSYQAFSGWIQRDGYEYRKWEKPTDHFDTAVEVCEEWGADVLTFDSAREHDWFLNLFWQLSSENKVDPGTHIGSPPKKRTHPIWTGYLCSCSDEWVDVNTGAAPSFRPTHYMGPTGKELPSSCPSGGWCTVITPEDPDVGATWKNGASEEELRITTCVDPPNPVTVPEVWCKRPIAKNSGHLQKMYPTRWTSTGAVGGIHDGFFYVFGGDVGSTELADSRRDLMWAFPIRDVAMLHDDYGQHLQAYEIINPFSTRSPFGQVLADATWDATTLNDHLRFSEIGSFCPGGNQIMVGTTMGCNEPGVPLDSACTRRTVYPVCANLDGVTRGLDEFKTSTYVYGYGVEESMSLWQTTCEGVTPQAGTYTLEECYDACTADGGCTDFIYGQSETSCATSLNDCTCGFVTACTTPTTDGDYSVYSTARPLFDVEHLKHVGGFCMQPNEVMTGWRIVRKLFTSGSTSPGWHDGCLYSQDAYERRTDGHPGARNYDPGTCAFGTNPGDKMRTVMEVTCIKVKKPYKTTKNGLGIQNFALNRGESIEVPMPNCRVGGCAGHEWNDPRFYNYKPRVIAPSGKVEIEGTVAHDVGMGFPADDIGHFHEIGGRCPGSMVAVGVSFYEEEPCIDNYPRNWQQGVLLENRVQKPECAAANTRPGMVMRFHCVDLYRKIVKGKNGENRYRVKLEAGGGTKPGPGYLHNAAGGVYNGNLIVYGGVGDLGEGEWYPSELWSFNIQSTSWKILCGGFSNSFCGPHRPGRRSAAASFVWQNYFVVVGGYQYNRRADSISTALASDIWAFPLDDCLAGSTMCKGDCVDLMRNINNCGECGVACKAGDTCTDGYCRPAAPGPKPAMMMGDKEEE
eukprot:TRINITY_DN63758_c0_g1_i1.p1 TRINITY_DN63758_c0_g1~~TRINITY_DN63758_c0_g1_i1.p1  ORF type:complete len:1908 (-),score=202.06 TRINITY_DN63758_c0_g1_i1:121-5337(-)